MSLLIRSSLAAALLSVTFLGLSVRADTAAVEELDRASEAKLNASSVSDLDEVIRLCRSAIKKGLGELDTQFADNLLAATLIQRGTVRTQMLSKSFPSDPRWAEYRKAALADLEEGVKLSPKQAKPFLFIAQLNLLPGGDAQRASEAMDRAIALSEEDPAFRATVLTLRAGTQKDAGKKKSDLDEAIRLAPNNAPALRTRGLLLAEQRKLEAALADLDQAIEAAPKHTPTYELKALVLAQMKKYDEALATLDELSKLVPTSAGPLLQKARIYITQKNLPDALEALNRAESIEPGNPAVLLLRAAIYQELGDNAKAMADVEQLLKLKPGLPAALRLRATLLVADGRLDEAIGQLETLRRQNPDDELVLLQLGTLYTAAEKPEKAIQSFTALLARRPDSWRALRSRGDTLLAIGKQEEAIDDYEKALKLQPKDPGILNNLAWVLATSPIDKLRDGQQAVELATEACQLTDYKQAHILSTLAAAYAEKGDLSSAIKWSKKAVEIGDEAHRDALRKELKSYQAGKPWREAVAAP